MVSTQLLADILRWPFRRCLSRHPNHLSADAGDKSSGSTGRDGDRPRWLTSHNNAHASRMPQENSDQAVRVRKAIRETLRNPPLQTAHERKRNQGWRMAEASKSAACSERKLRIALA